MIWNGMQFKLFVSEIFHFYDYFIYLFLFFINTFVVHNVYMLCEELAHKCNTSEFLFSSPYLLILSFFSFFPAHGCST